MNRQLSSLTLDSGTGPQDLLLVQSALSGDRPSVDAVMQRLACVVRFVVRLNKTLGYNLPTEGLEDVAQQVYVAVWSKLGEFGGTSALETWVYGFCRNCLRAEFRRRSARPRPLPTGEGLVDERIDGSAPEDRAVQMESVDLLHEEIVRLDPLEREIVELRHLQEWSFERIARQKNLPPSTIKDRCYKALDRIRLRLKRHYGRA